MTDKKYLKWYNKVGYGSGDIAGNVVYALLSSFVMIYLTDTVGLNAGIVGTLIAVSKIFDGISDIFFGALIDKTKTKMGKARPWMLYGYFGCAICLIAIFCIPTDMGQIAQYAWFFITYTLLNAGFYTANNIAYSALTALITRNNHERVQMGSIRFMFAFGTSMLIQVITVDIVNNLGGGADAWRTVAIVYAIIGVISNTISVFSVKEFSQKEIAKEETEKEEKYGLIDAFKLLVHNKYFLMICGAYLLMQIYSATLGMGIYFMKYVLGDEEIFGVFAWAINIPMIAGLLLTPILVKKLGGMYRLNIVGYIVGVHGEGFSMQFDKREGGISSLVYDGAEYITRAPKISFFRAMTDNDTGAGYPQDMAQWQIAGKCARLIGDRLTTEEKSDNLEITFVFAAPTVPSFEYKIIYNAYFDGRLGVKAEYPGVQGMSDMPVFAMDFKLKKQYDKFTFYGMGPDENYIDRNNGARLGVFTSNAQDNFSKYLNPQECGNRTGVRYVSVYDENSAGLKFKAAEQPFEMSVLPYSAYELDNATHREELPEASYTWVRIAAKQMGVGGDDSWGAPVHEEFKIKAENKITLEFIINSL